MNDSSYAQQLQRKNSAAMEGAVTTPGLPSIIMALGKPIVHHAFGKANRPRDTHGFHITDHGIKRASALPYLLEDFASYIGVLSVDKRNTVFLSSVGRDDASVAVEERR